METKNIFKIIKGFFTDSTKQDQPKGTYSFALNAVKETDQGDNTVLSNEEADVICTKIKPGYVLLGKVYMNKDKVALFSVSSNESASEIGIFDAKSCTYTAVVNDLNSPDKNKLKFKIQNQIDATYRLRLGCEDTVYWVDGNNKARYFNFSKPNDFKDQNGNWVAAKFNLQKTYEKIPEISNIQVLDSGGSIPPGSINFSIQYVDESMNPTEWIKDTPTVKIYNDLSSKSYAEITGSINSEMDFLSFPNTSKSIKIEFNNLDENYMYYRLAIICSTTGTGEVNDVYYTEVIPTSKKFFIYTGTNHETRGTEEEIKAFNSIINSPKHIEQEENRLILANTEGDQVNHCVLQKYASRIKADCIVKEINLNDIKDKSNSKNAVHEFNNGIGYMPGEIYSFGIVYIYEDLTLSPVFHIAGKNSDHGDIVFAPEVDNLGNNITYAMSPNNSSDTNIYIENNSCGSGSYWGLDYAGRPLANKPVRHHRFPLRSEIGVPLIENSYSPQQDTFYYQLQLKVLGKLLVPIPCPEDNPTCGTDAYNTFEIKVEYKINGEDFSFTEFVDPSSYADGVSDTFELELYDLSNYHNSNNITDIVISITDPTDGSFYDVTSYDLSTYFDTSDEQPTFSTEIIQTTSTVKDKLVKTKILGIKFSGIDQIPIEETNGLKVIGYYIVRNERTEFEKTILDSGVLIPNLRNSRYVSHGILYPEAGLISNNTVSIIHPEHKFNGKEYTTYDNIISQGYFSRFQKKYGKVNYDDVSPGTSYIEKKMHKKNDDAEDADGSPTSFGLDGWSFNLISRDNILNFNLNNNLNPQFNIPATNIKERFYLDALESRSIESGSIDMYNLAADNKIGMIQFNSSLNLNGKLPYVVLYKNNSDPYSNFRLLPYYNEMVNPKYFSSDGSSSSVSIFNGDSYITPMRYSNSIFYDNRVAYRKLKVPAWKIIVGALVVVAAVVVSVFTFGTATPLAAGLSAAAITALVGTGLTIAGLGAMLLSSGIKQANFNKAYGEEYNKGLRNTVLDLFTIIFYGYTPFIPFGYGGSGQYGQDGPTDDTIEWATDCLTDLWFESSVNINLRNRFVSSDSPTFLYSPWRIESGNDSPIQTWKIKGVYYTNSNAPRYPISSLERHGVQKLLGFDQTRDDNRYYLGIPLGEYYNVNPDYHRRAKQKVYFHLPLEYDCCSDCLEKFKHRVHYSEQSFQEDLIDNFRVFLPNNYRDIEGETGEITNLFRFGNDLYIQTEEALWQLPKNYQERITDQIVSFIGTGDYFSVPPRKVIDDSTGNSAGTRHKWGVIKTPEGVFFPSEHQNKIYKFNGRNIEPISDYGRKGWFKENTEIQADKNYYLSVGEEYPFKNNPSNYHGTGFISTYDSRKDRFIITKKDFVYNFEDIADSTICIRNGILTTFPSLQETIADKESEGWTYIGIEDCRLKFKRNVYTKEEVEWSVMHSSEKMKTTTDIIVHFDGSGSLGEGSVDNLKATVLEWFTVFTIMNPDYQGKLYYLHTKDGCEGQTWLRVLNWLQNSGSSNLNVVNIDLVNPTGHGDETPATFAEVSKDFTLISLVNEAAIGYCGGEGEYHEAGISNTIPSPSSTYISDFNDFYTRYDSLVADGYNMNFLQYPVVSTNSFVFSQCEGMIQSVIAAVDGGNTITPDIINKISTEINLYIPSLDYQNLIDSLSGPNPYPLTPDGRSLRDLHWDYIHTRGWDNTPGTPIIPVPQFTEDVELFLLGSNDVNFDTITETVTTVSVEYSYVEGEATRNPLPYLKNSWTKSFDIKENFWISMHSYLPNFYINIPEDFYSWDNTLVNSDNNIYKHNVLGRYQTFRGELKPFIVEYVVNDNPLVTKIFDYIQFNTEAKKYNSFRNEFVEEKDITFNKAIFYNTKQCSGILNLVVKDTTNDPENYLQQQISNLDGDTIIIDRNEMEWSLNQIRDLRSDYSVPIFNKNLPDLQSDYYIDKVVNLAAIDYDKIWSQQESFRDKYLVVRLIFDNLDDVKLLFNFAIDSNVTSIR